MRTTTRVLCLLACCAVPALAQDRSITIGQSQSAELTGHDPIARSRKAPYHVWSFQGRRGQRIVIDLHSSDFDAYVVLRDDAGFLLGNDDDGGGNNDSRLHTVLPRDGGYRIIATGFNENSRGRYVLTVSGWEAPDAPAPGTSGSIASGETKDGMLEPGDEIAGDGPYQDRWTFDARAGQRLRIDLMSTDFDSYLILMSPEGEQLATDDDGGEGSNNASIGFRAATAGRYTVIATSYGENVKTGAYRIRLTEDTGTFTDPGVASAINPGETKEGRLETGDVTGHRGMEDHWTFTARAGQLARIDVMATQFDAYATLMFNGTAIDSNDDGGDGQNARLMTILPGTGTYTVVVSAFGSSSSGGRYSVALQVTEAPAGAGHIERINVGQRVSGRLEPGDRPHGGGFEDVWEFDGRANQDVLIEMHSSDFDSYLELKDEGGAIVAQDDDGGGGNDALILAHLPHAGKYRIVARSYAEREQTGVYDLSLSAAGDVARPGRSVALEAGQLTLGRLEAGDSLVGDSTYADLFTFRAARDGEVTIDLSTGDFDAYLIVKDSEGATLATDDDGGEGTNARITLSVRSGRTYRIYANSYGEDRATGLYRLVLRYGH